ncbi:conserved hypothetical protein [Leishmania major strain Friedlin]|uniref:Uncharacterized protein n=1 Tax=Leishmania major TaxID=5664 RepID=Q4Q955_LEIMA|nr:conserved hypothetical protein [Leishmania major strain Friedlin]CAG9576460.1 hypothetical_protein_-_conserved [Leishmania major strain Friedlin]CAJ05249.1 conserved hypothetical protein [Leishmania major strain Friedlin]|eukprot:XP_001684143.1 conserved hypothetical protein [Leishmania major strain Friedlin]
MKRLPPSLYVSCYYRSYSCRTAAGGSGDMLRCRISPVPSARTSGVVCGIGSNPPPGASRERLISFSPSPLIAQWQQRRHMHDAAIAPALQSHNAATVAAITDDQISGSLLTASPEPSSVCTPSSSTANTSGSTDHTPESLLLTQLQMLAKQDHGTPTSDRGKGVVDSGATGADVPVLSKSAGPLAALASDADMCASGSPDDSTLASSHNDVPAWRRGLELVQTASCVTAAVTEWLLFLCLRSHQSATDAAESLTAAPLEVCEGVYSAWRELHRGQKTESDVAAAAAADVANAVAVSTSAHQLQPSSPLMSDSPSSARAHLPRHRSPFSPKGIHHHYATYLLRELHHAETAAVSHTATRKGSSGTHGDGNDCKALMPTKDSDAAHAAPTHRMRYLLHRVLEVLLVHLPQDLAAAAAGSAAKTAEPTCGVKRRRSQQRQPSLRPTTALLVLEAARHAASFHRQSSTLSSVGPSGNFSLLSFLRETAHGTGSPPDAPAASPSPTHSALAAVAREAFETIMRSSATAPTDTSAAASQQQHRLQNDALVLYVAFLATICMPPMPERCLEVELQVIDSFVLAGSPTARQVGGPSPHQQQQAVSSRPPRSLVSADRASRDESGSASSASALATAAGVRWLMATYLSPSASSASSASSAPVSGPRAEASRRQWDLTRDAVVAALCRPNSLLMSGSCEPSSVAPVHNQGVCGVPSSAPPAPLPWCAWMLRALLLDDAHQQQKSGSGTASLGGGLRSDTDEMSTLALSIQLVMELRRHSQATLTCHGSPRWEEHRQHRLDTLLRRPLQLVWATLLDAAVRGQLIPANSCSVAADNGVATQHSARAGSCPHGSTPAVLQRLCYPHYDKTQWRRGTVNLYMQLLDQWGESTQVRQVFAAVARREREWQLEVREAVLAERRGLVSAGEKVGGGDEDDSRSIGDSEAEGLSTAEGQAAASTARADSHKPMVVRVFRRYRPALNLESCLITLRHCGFPRRVFAELWDGPASAKDASEGTDGTPAAAAQAKLAGEVLQYMIGLLHVAERRPHRAAPSGGGADANREQESRGDGTKTPHALSTDGGPGANLGDSTMEADGLPVSHWVAWIRKSCVPTLAHLYQSAGLEDEWAQLGYGHE